MQKTKLAPSADSPELSFTPEIGPDIDLRAYPAARISAFLIVFGHSTSCFVVVVFSSGSLPRGGDVGGYVIDINQPSLPTPFYSVLVSVSVFMTISTVFHSVNFPENSPLYHSVPLVLLLPHWPFQLSTSL